MEFCCEADVVQTRHLANSAAHKIGLAAAAPETLRLFPLRQNA